MRIFLAAIVLHMIGAPYPRYGIPFMPFAYALAVVAAAALVQRVTMARRRSPDTQPSVVVAATNET